MTPTPKVALLQNLCAYKTKDVNPVVDQFFSD